MTGGRGKRGGGRPRDPNSGDEPESFADWVEGRDDVKPITRRSVSTAKARPSTPRLRSKPKSKSKPATAPPHFHRPLEGEPLLGHHSSVRKRELGRLRAGSIRPEGSIDLHGRDRSSAREHLTARVAAARHQRLRCVLVIHGRGHHSESGEAVLRRAVPGWLDAPPLRDDVLAFAPAQPADGGAGATYLLLR
ncbi:MAG: Smr/MutS family protein [Deltaproteobacteria bacterium]|nr:Smr/MutS family protein [Deltaproteobacteria bacterium]